MVSGGDCLDCAGLPVPREEFGEPGGRVIVDPAEDIGEPGLRVASRIVASAQVRESGGDASASISTTFPAPGSASGRPA
jgi:hypothetical protein